MRNHLFLKSKVMRNNALSNLEESKKDSLLEDSYFDIACYNAQQAIEFILKAILDKYSVTFEPENADTYDIVADKRVGHDILYILNLVIEKTPFDFEKKDDLKLLAATITSWEQRGRYQTGIKTKETTVRRILNIYKNIETEYTNSFSEVPKE